MGELINRFSGIQRDGGTEQRFVLGNTYGATNRDSHIIAAFPAGNIIPGGRFLIHDPKFVLNADNLSGTQQGLALTLPDKEGTLLADEAGTNYSTVIASVKNADGNFVFVGVSANGLAACKRFYKEPVLNTPPACPIGYSEAANLRNYWPVYGGAMDVVTKGMTTVYAEKAINVTDTLFVRVKKLATATPCQFIGGVTNVADAGTQPLVGITVRIISPCAAGDSLAIELG